MIELAVLGRGKVVVVGHRGAMAHAPENTLASFRKAMELRAHAAECDVRLTADGEVVLLHDPTVDRVTNGTGFVGALTLRELKRLDAGSWFGPQYAGERIPTLAELLELVRSSSMELVIELKGEPEPPPALIARTVELVRSYGMCSRTCIISFNHACLRAVTQLDPSIATGILFGHATPEPIDEALAVGARSLRPHHSRVTAALVSAAHALGLAVHAWTANSPELVRALAAMGVDSIGTDAPDVARAELAAMGLLAC